MNESTRDGLVWQTRVWDRVSRVYRQEIDQRFRPIVESVVARASLAAGDDVLDLGTGTGSVALLAAGAVAPGGRVLGADISQDMLALARDRARTLGLANVYLSGSAAENIPAKDDSFDVVLASLSLMFVTDRRMAARELGRVLRAGGRLVAAVWAGPGECDLVRFQLAAGRFAGPPPVAGVGPGALADPGPLIAQFSEAGIHARVERETFSFEFDDLDAAWETFAGVTASKMNAEQVERAKVAVAAEMGWRGRGRLQFRNETQFIVGTKAR